MARLVLTPQSPASLSPYPALPLVADSADVTFTAAGTAFIDGAGFTLTGRELILVRNPTAGALTATISSVPDRRKRSGTITAYSVGAGEIAAFGPHLPEGWQQADGQLFLSASAAGLEFAILRLPSIR